MIITIAAFALQAIPNAGLDAEVGAEVEWLVLIGRVRHGYWYAKKELQQQGGCVLSLVFPVEMDRRFELSLLWRLVDAQNR